MPVQYSYLEAARINEIMQGLQDPRLIPTNLPWQSRIPSVSATDEEILARWIGTVTISDIIEDDAKAVTYSQGRLQYETTKIPNIKHGIQMSQQALSQLQRIQAKMATGRDLGLFSQWENRTIAAILLGIQQRKEALLVAMLLDNLDYNRYGVIMSGVTWGMPSDLKVTSSVTWDTAGSATPVTDILNTKLVANTRYGMDFNRITMSTTTFRYMVATTEFLNQARLFGFGFGSIPFPTVPLQSFPELQTIAQRICQGMQIELYDSRYWSQDAGGNITSFPFLPNGKVILSNTANDGNSEVMNWANAEVIEPMVATKGSLVGSLPMGEGPMSYATVPFDLNPPNITYWGVQRGFPRKKLLQANAVITAGTFTDTIAVGVPFPS